jgi:hypothetical protein
LNNNIFIYFVVEGNAVNYHKDKGIQGWGVVLSTPAYEQAKIDDKDYFERLEEREGF